MKLPQFKKFRWNYLALAFVVPFVSLLMILVMGGYAPFGTGRALLYSDEYHQYYPFFKAFRAALLSGESLLYSWDVGMGMDYLGLASYYLASPLNLLSVCIPESWTLGYFELLMPIKLSLASLFFAIFLKKLFGKDDLSIVLFGGFYGLCAWALGYQWNIMWLDTFALLPLLALGTILLLRDKKFVLYTVTLFLSVWSNYYVGFFSCIFVLLLFICYQICRCKSPLRLLQDFVRIGVFTVLALGMTAALELPTLAALQTTQSSVNSYPKYFSLNMVKYELTQTARAAWDEFRSAKDGGNATFALFWNALKESVSPILNGMKQVAGNMAGGLEPTFVDGLPNLYCGVGTVFFAFLFLTAKQVKLRDKICGVFMILLFMLSFIIRQLDYIWHGFHFTNQIPYRFSFLFSFVMLYMAYRAFLLRRQYKIWQLLVAAVLSVGIFLCSADLTDPVFLAYNGVFLLLYVGFVLVAKLEKPPVSGNRQQLKKYFASRKQMRACATWFLAGTFALELILNVVNFGVSFPYTGISDYPRGTENAASMIEYMKEREEDTLFYRAETTHTQTLNDGALNGYHGISTFTSSANVKVTEFIEALGYSAKNTYNRYCFEESSPVSNLFLNLKYMVERLGRVEENQYFEDVHSYGYVHLLENKAYLPLGFLAEKALANTDLFTNASKFYIQSKMLCDASGVPEQAWHMLTNANQTIIGEGVTINREGANGYVAYTAGSSGGTLKYVFGITKDGFMCIDFNLSARNSFTVWRNGVQLYSESMTLEQMLAVSDVKVGDTIEVHITCKADENSTSILRAAILDDETFQRSYEILAACPLELTQFSNTYIEGTIDCNRDGLLYTSIPQDGNWTAMVDGQPAEIKLVGGAMVAVELTEGAHTVSFTYRNKAFELGLAISLGCLAVFLAICCVVYFRQIKEFAGKCKVYLRKFKK